MGSRGRDVPFLAQTGVQYRAFDALTMFPIDKTLVPCEGGPCAGLGLLVEQPNPREIRHEGGGSYVLEERGAEENPDLVYVYVET